MTHTGMLAFEQNAARGAGNPWRRVASDAHRGSMRVLARQPSEAGAAAPEVCPETQPMDPTAAAHDPASPRGAPVRLRPVPRGFAVAAAGISGRAAALEPRMLLPRAHVPVVESAGAARVAELEGLLRAALEELGQKTTDVRNLTGRVKDLEPLVERVRARDARLDEVHAELRRSRAERETERLRRAAAEDALAGLRAEIDWRDYVIRDLEPMPDQLRASERFVAQLRDELAECRAEVTSLQQQVAAVYSGDAPPDVPAP